MADPQILDLTGIEIEMRAVRGTGNTFRATFETADVARLSLLDYNVVLKVVDRAGGTVMHTQTNTPDDHEDAPNGETLLNIPASAFATLTGQRPYTWKYQITTVHVVTGEPHVHFYGDLRVYPPLAPV